MDIVSLGSSVEDEESPLVFLEKVHLFRDRVDKFVKTPLPSLINLSVTPRAAAYLQQHWPAVSIGRLEEAPVPKVCCCARCGSGESKAKVVGSSREARNTWHELPVTSVVLLGLLLLLAVLWLNPVRGESLRFSLLSQFVHSFSSEFIFSVCEMAASAYAVMGTALHRWSSQLSLVSDEAFQQVVAFFKTLTSR